MQLQKHNPASRYKILFLAICTCLSLGVIVTAWSIRNDPRLMAASILSSLMYVSYESSFYVSNTFGDQTFYPTTATYAAMANQPAQSVPVLVYHGVLTEPDGSTINVTREQFKEHMFALKRAGYTTLTLQELYEYGTGNAALPPAPLVITFDDGRSDSYYNADPALNAVDYTASMYAITGYANGSEPGSYYLSPKELVYMTKTGRWEIGSHSALGHATYPTDDQGNEGNFYSHQLWIPTEARLETNAEFQSRIYEDFLASQQYLEGILGSPVRAFAFPFGDFGQNQVETNERVAVITSTASRVYDLMFYQHEPGAYYTQFTRPTKPTPTDTLLVRRINIDTRWDTDTLLRLLHNGQNKPLPYEDTFSEDNGWLTVWGDHVIKDGILHMYADADSAGASTILDGTAIWRDYEVTIDATAPSGTGFFMWTRFQNDKNNAGCNFGTNFVHAEQMREGIKNVLSGVRFTTNNIPTEAFTASARVEGRTLICSINGTEIVRTEFLDPSLDHGGVGLKIWDATLGKSVLHVNTLTVSPLNETAATGIDDSQSKLGNQ